MPADADGLKSKQFNYLLNMFYLFPKKLNKYLLLSLEQLVLDPNLSEAQSRFITLCERIQGISEGLIAKARSSDEVLYFVPNEQQLKALRTWLSRLPDEVFNQAFQEISRSHLDDFVRIRRRNNRTIIPNIEDIRYILALGSVHRPIYDVFLDHASVQSIFTLYGAVIDVDKFRQKLNEYYDDSILTDGYYKPGSLEHQLYSGFGVMNQCKLAMLFFQNPTEELKVLLLTSDAADSSKYLLLALLCYLFKKDDTSFYDGCPLFQSYLATKPACLHDAVKAAAAFGSVQWIRLLKRLNLLDASDYNQIAKIAAASNDVETLKEVYDFVKPQESTRSQPKVGHYIQRSILSVEGKYYHKSKYSAMFWAIRKNRLLALTYMISRGGLKEPGAQARYLLTAARCNHPDVVDVLLTNGVDVNARDEYGESALDVALECEFSELETLLRARGAISRIDNAERASARCRATAMR